MRDPELVFKAQLAAAALERAWQRWRVVHGLMAEPMPTISSYVGYSLEEPWGQPRVVFGLSAEDAEQLVALLDRHDCIGPVHAKIAAGQGGRELPTPASDPAGRPVPGLVPAQATSIAAESVSAEQPVPAPWSGVAGRRPRFVPTPEQRDERDGPVFRQVVAAAQRAAATRDAAPAGIVRSSEEAGPVLGAPEAGPGRWAAEAGPSWGPPEAGPGWQAPRARPGPQEPEMGAGATGFEPAGSEQYGATGSAGQEAGRVRVDAPSRSPEAVASSLPGAGQAGVASPAGVDSIIPADLAAADDQAVADEADAADEPDAAEEPPAADEPPAASELSLVGTRPGLAIVDASTGEPASDQGALGDVGELSRGECNDTAQSASDAAADADAEEAPGPAEAGTVAGAADAEAGPRPGHPAGRETPEPADGPGPLAQAASAARVEAEARIRAALHPAGAAGPAATDHSDGSGPADAGPAAAEAGPAAVDAGDGVVGAGWPAGQTSAPRLEVASQAQPLAEEPADSGAGAADRDHPHDVASSWGGPDFDDEAGDAGQGAFMPASGEAGYEAGHQNAGAEPDMSADEPKGHAPSGYARRTRITRSYSIPRLSRSKRPGALPGAQQSG
jgi:hypothetical protein